MSSNPFSDLYGSIPELRRVWELDYKGEKVQVMVMSKSTFNCVINRFGCSVSKVWWKGGEIQVTEEFLISHHLKVNIIKNDYNAKESYVKKMAIKFPEYEEFEEAALPQLKEDYHSWSKTPQWIMRNLGDEQTYENSKYLFENSLKFKDAIKLGEKGE